MHHCQDRKRLQLPVRAIVLGGHGPFHFGKQAWTGRRVLWPLRLGGRFLSPLKIFTEKSSDFCLLMSLSSSRVLPQSTWHTKMASVSKRLLRGKTVTAKILKALLKEVKSFLRWPPRSGAWESRRMLIIVLVYIPISSEQPQPPLSSASPSSHPPASSIKPRTAVILTCCPTLMSCSPAQLIESCGRALR